MDVQHICSTSGANERPCDLIAPRPGEPCCPRAVEGGAHPQRVASDRHDLMTALREDAAHRGHVAFDSCELVGVHHVHDSERSRFAGACRRRRALHSPMITGRLERAPGPDRAIDGSGSIPFCSSSGRARSMLTQARRLTAIVALVLVPVLVAQIAVGGLLSSNPALAWLVAVAFVGVVLLLTAPGAVLVAALPATYLFYRVGPTSTDISLADVALAVAVLAALPFVPWRSPTLRSMLRLLSAYLLILLIAVVAVPSQRGFVEVGHRAFLVAGGLLVGAAIVATGRATRALRAFVFASAIVSIAAVADAAAHTHSGGLPDPAYPFGIQKNTAGFLIACAVIVMVVAARQLAIPRRVGIPCASLLLIGVLACQARGPALMLVAVVLLWAIRERRVRLSPVLLIGGILLVGMTYITLNAAFQSDSQDSRFDSVNSRVATYDAAVSLWERDPLVGVGLKYWRDPAFVGETAFGEPHDLAVAALGESGVIGLAALVVLVIGSIILLVKSPSPFGLLAVLIVIAKTFASTVDIYWVAGTLTFTWIIVGFACAAGPTETTEDVSGVLEAASR